MNLPQSEIWRVRFLALAALILCAALMRILPHPWNMTPIAAIALFGGANFEGRLSAFLVPLAAMLLSDIMLELITGRGFHALMPVIYGTFALMTFMGFLLRGRATPLPILAALIASGLLFYLITNFAVWAEGGIYPRTIEGLLSCYIAGIPFLRDQMMGDLLYGFLLFGGWERAKRAFPSLAT